MISLSCPIVTIYESCILAMLASLLELGPGVVLAAFSGILLMSVYRDLGSEYITMPRGDALD